MSTHAKACTQCGATRTPQWREGPLGPKTLCNACGVKQFRLNKRARDDGTKRRTPTPTKRKAVDAPRPPRARPGRDWLLEAARVAQEHLLDDERLEHRRPPRKAAAKALLKSIEWAHGGEWVEGPRSVSDTSATSGITAQASDRAEEVAFEPRGTHFGRDTQAAVDLLTLCHSTGDVLHAAEHLPMLDEAMDADELMQVVALTLPTSLPASLLDGVAAARDEMVAAFRAKEQADLAVRTVAKVGVWMVYRAHHCHKHRCWQTSRARRVPSSSACVLRLHIFMPRCGTLTFTASSREAPALLLKWQLCTVNTEVD